MTDGYLAGSHLRLLLAPEPDLLSVARGFVASAFQVCNQPPQLVDDARLAVSELLTVFVLAKVGPLDLAITEDGGDLVVTISAPSLPALSSQTAELVEQLAPGGLQREQGRYLLRFPRK